MVKGTAVLFMLILLVACAPSPSTGIGGTTYDPAVNATLAARQAQDAGATYEAVQRATAVVIEQTAVAAQNATGTAVASVSQTAEAAAMMASQTAVAATATSESLSVQATGIALIAVQTANAQTAEAAAAALNIEQTRQAQEIMNVEMARADKARMLENMRAREAMWNQVIPILMTALFIVGVGLLGFVLAYLWRSKQPVINVVVNGRTLPMVLDGGGGWKMLPNHVVSNALQLPAPTAVEVRPEPLPALPEGHVLIAGPTRSGKSTAMRALLQHRQDVVVLDPHAAPGDWGTAQVKGAGRNFAEIEEFMRWMAAELDRRAHARAQGMTNFPDMTVATDEMPSIASALGRDTYMVWQQWVREGWKYGLYFAVSTQSMRVKTMGIEGEGDVLANFVAAILLGSEAVNSYPELVAGMERPAVIRTIDGVKPVIIPQVASSSSPTPSANGGYVAAPVINLPSVRSVAESDGRALDGVIHECLSLNDVGRVLMDTDPENKETRPSGQLLRERVRPALAWRINYLSCPDSSRILMDR